MRFEVRLLGPLEVMVRGAPVRVTGRPSALLAVLAMAAGRTVPLERLVEAAWGLDPPVNPRASLQTNITRLRGLIGTDLIDNSPAGYALRADPDHVDALLFLRLVTDPQPQPGGEAERRALAEALALWRGQPFEGIDSDWLTGSPSLRLVEAHLSALERQADLDLAAGRHENLAPRLLDLIERHPLRESLWVRLLAALDATGRHAEALEQYETIRRRLAEELGTDPGPQLRAVYAALLNGVKPVNPPTAVPHAGPHRAVPRQLPVDINGFVGREKILAAMDGRLGDANAPVAVTTIGGMGGIGKTALAVHWAHRVVGWFPDGQLYANLHGFDPTAAPRPPADVLRDFLGALDIAPQRIPAGLAAQAALFRSLLAGRRVLVLLDNASDAEQVRPLLPGTPGSHVVVTSRDWLTGLIAVEGARPLALDELSFEEAWQLLQRRLGAQRVKADPRATEAVIARCAGLPLALAVVAARAAQRPDTPLGVLTAGLGGGQTDLDAFAERDPMIDVRAVFSWSYRILSPAGARLFRLLSVHPGPDVPVRSAAAIAGLTPAETLPLLAELTAAHLLNEPVAERYVFHDLLRAYSAELTALTDPPGERDEAFHRILDYYLHSAHAAAESIDPSRVPIPMDPPRPGVTAEEFADHQQAGSWFTAEWKGVLAAAHQAIAAGSDRHAWRMAWSITGFLDLAGYWEDDAALMLATIHIAPSDPDWPWQGYAHRALGHVYARMERYAEAETHSREALRLFRERGDAAGQARSHLNLGIIFDRLGRSEDSAAEGRAALELYRSAGHLAGQADALNSIGWDLAQLGRYEEALEMCRQSLELHQKLAHRHGQADLWDSLGYIYHHLGDHDQAVAAFGNAIGIFRELRDRFDETSTLLNLGDAHLDAGDRAGARDAWREALTILEELEHPTAATARAKLADLAAGA